MVRVRILPAQSSNPLDQDSVALVAGLPSGASISFRPRTSRKSRPDLSMSLTEGAMSPSSWTVTLASLERGPRLGACDASVERSGDRTCLLGAAGGVLSHARLHDACDQVSRKGSVGSESEGPLARLERL